jgi:hypothetical protein
MIYCDGDFDLSENAIPDMSDPATLGAFLAIVREAWGDPTARLVPHVVPGKGLWWYLMGPREDSVGDGPTEAEALCVALEAAPR